MASYTEHLQLLKKDPVADGADTFNIQTMLNDNWDKIDEVVAKKAELGEDGKVPPEQLPEMDFDEAGSAAAVQKNLDAHTGNKNNPHAVTAAQVGAAIELSEGGGITTLDELLAKRPSGFYGVSPPSTGFPRSDYWNVIVWADTRVPSGGNYTRAIYASPVNSNELWKLQITNGGNKGWVRLVTESDLASKSSVQTGSYAGTGSSTLDLDLPIEPKVLILAGSYQAPLVITGVGDYYCIYDNVSGKSVDVTEFGKHVSLEGENTYSAYNESGSTYFWAALY